ncbi:MAG: hypothetical protein HKN59_08405 [Gammaproteobacteria bacterium]|nr:hypothetical protein [Gammaproteobacteria bacterium]
MNLKSMALCCGFTLSLAGCSALPAVTQPTPATGKEPAQEVAEQAAPLPAAGTSARSPAVAALLSKARSERQDGQPEKATVTLERALRIESRDPELWLELAGAAYEKEDFNASAEFAARAGRLAGNDEALRRKAEKLGRAARLQIE